MSRRSRFPSPPNKTAPGGASALPGWLWPRRRTVRRDARSLTVHDSARRNILAPNRQASQVRVSKRDLKIGARKGRAAAHQCFLNPFLSLFLFRAIRTGGAAIRVDFRSSGRASPVISAHFSPEPPKETTCRNRHHFFECAECHVSSFRVWPLIQSILDLTKPNRHSATPGQGLRPLFPARFLRCAPCSSAPPSGVRDKAPLCWRSLAGWTVFIEDA
jgi:hypothetical protein